MRKRESRTEAEGFHIKSESNRYARKKIPFVCGHICPHLVVICCRDIEIVGGREFESEYQVTEKIAHES